MPSFVTNLIAKLKANKIAVAVIIGAAAAADYVFGLGVSEYVLDLLASAPEVP
jgi:hypothetical protein